MHKYFSETLGQQPHPDENKEARQNQRILGLQELARADAAGYLKQRLTDIGKERISPSMEPVLPWNVEFPWKAEFLHGVSVRIAGKVGGIQDEDYEIYLEEFEKECRLGYPQVKQ